MINKLAKLEETALAAVGNSFLSHLGLFLVVRDHRPQVDQQMPEARCDASPSKDKDSTLVAVHRDGVARGRCCCASTARRSTRGRRRSGRRRRRRRASSPLLLPCRGCPRGTTAASTSCRCSALHSEEMRGGKETRLFNRSSASMLMGSSRVMSRNALLIIPKYFASIRSASSLVDTESGDRPPFVLSEAPLKLDFFRGTRPFAQHSHCLRLESVLFSPWLG